MMQRLLGLFLVSACAAAIAFWFTDRPGVVVVNWLGWQMETSISVGLIALVGLTFIALSLWRFVLWVWTAPARAARAKEGQRRRRGLRAAAEGLVAAAAGDATEARRLSLKAERYLDEPLLIRLLKAQTAEAAADHRAAQDAYAAMLGFPETALLGHRGLMLAAQRRGDQDVALAHARAAYAAAKTARWAWDALFDAQIQAGDWSGARTLLTEAEARKLLDKKGVARYTAALLAAEAAEFEQTDGGKALGLAQDALKRAPTFAPAAVLAARLLVRANKGPKAVQVLEEAFKAAPHPALAQAYRDLKSDETPKARSKRLMGLYKINPEHREGRVVLAEACLLAGDAVGARQALASLLDDAPSARLCGLMARVAYANAEPEEARGWINRAAHAPQEPDWSDLDPEGEAFAYTRADWAQMVKSYGATGQLAHPRFERRDPVAASGPTLAALSPQFITPALRPDDPGTDWVDDELDDPEDAIAR
jgi:HemY protein